MAFLYHLRRRDCLEVAGILHAHPITLMMDDLQNLLCPFFILQL